MYRFSAVVLALAVMLAVALALARPPAAMRAVADSPVLTLEPFDGDRGWLNSKPLSPRALSGRVVLVDFWEYTCINCLKTLPYEKAWYDRYAKYGFTIIGVHTPEFAFSGEPANVAAAVNR